MTDKYDSYMWNVPVDMLEKQSSVSVTFNNLTNEEAKAVNSYKEYFFSLWDLDQWLRNELKHKELPENVDVAYDTIRDKIREIMDEYNCSLDDLT